MAFRGGGNQRTGTGTRAAARLSHAVSWVVERRGACEVRGGRVHVVAGAAALTLRAGLGLVLGGAAAGRAVARPQAATPAAGAFDRGRFAAPTRVDNRWWPLVPGTRFTLVGSANRGDGRRPHRVLFTVTDLTKVVDGVTTVVVWDRDFNAGRLLEDELAFNAQDDDGTVWNFGEYPEQYEHGRLTGAPDTWIVGRAGARAGIAMPGRPRLGTASYLQGWAPAIEFSDRARVFGTGRRTCVPLGCFRGVLEMDEWNPTEHGAHERKFYAPGVGNIRVGVASGKEREGLVLERVERLSAGAMVTVRRKALALDRRAYRVSPGVYGRTPRARRAGG
jgi:hypothetical protein